jgi:hypothetical protein
MFKTFKEAVLVPIASFAAISLLPVPAHAEGGDYLLPAFTAVGEFNTEQPARKSLHTRPATSGASKAGRPRPCPGSASELSPTPMDR